jgi:hypothetical protein
MAGGIAATSRRQACLSARRARMRLSRIRERDAGSSICFRY